LSLPDALISILSPGWRREKLPPVAGQRLRLAM